MPVSSTPAASGRTGCARPLARAGGSLSDPSGRARAARTRGNIYPKLLSFLAGVQLQNGDLRASYNTQKKLQQMDQQLGRTETVDHLASQRNEAVLLMGFGEYVEARTIIEAILERSSALSGDTSIPAWLSPCRKSPER